MEFKVRKEILQLQPYKAGKPIDEVKRELGIEKVIKLASNENSLGCSEKVKEVLKEMVDEANMYPDSSNHELKEAIALKDNVSSEQIFCSTGSDSLIKVICNTFINEGDESVMGEVTFSRYKDCTKLMGGKVISIPMKNHGLDLEKMVDAITEKTKLIWLCNPNNPTGTIFTKEELDRALERIPASVIVILDEAYIEYVTDEKYPNSISLLNKYPNIIILRTFSKAYGLAALRCGYGITNKNLCGYFNRVIGPFDVNLFAQKAAVTAIKDKDFINKVYSTNKMEKDYLYEELEKMSLEYIKTNTNFIMFNTQKDDLEIFNKLLQKGLIVRPGAYLGMKGWIRVTIGNREENRMFIEALKDCLK